MSSLSLSRLLETEKKEVKRISLQIDRDFTFLFSLRLCFSRLLRRRRPLLTSARARDLETSASFFPVRGARESEREVEALRKIEDSKQLVVVASEQLKEERIQGRNRGESLHDAPLLRRFEAGFGAS